jgi:hypothetical protein
MSKLPSIALAATLLAARDSNTFDALWREGVDLQQALPQRQAERQAIRFLETRR